MYHRISNITTILATLTAISLGRVTFGQVPINELTLKGTHNSYACSHRCEEYFGTYWPMNKCPVMHHHPQLQMDHFGVWAMEFDFSIKWKDGHWQAIVGHDGECGDGCWTHSEWGPRLDDYLARLRDTRSFAYRPIILRLEKKCCWGADSFDPPGAWMPFVEDILRQVFGDAAIYRYDEWVAGGRVWPTVPELSAKVIAAADTAECQGEGCPAGFGGNGILFPWSEFLSMAGEGDRCVTEAEIEAWSGSADVVKIDQYQYDYTFTHVAPPNPVCVDHSAPGSWLVSNDNPDGSWFSDEPCWIGEDCEAYDWCTEREFILHQQGTFEFPYSSVASAVNRAEDGWTVLIAPGHYPEAVAISKALTLKADGGTVTIGQ